jgi:aspartyl protease family protein
MSGATGLAVLLFAAALGAAYFGERQIAGLPADEFASLVALGALALVLAGGVINAFRGRWADGFRALLLWMAIGAVFVGMYSFRHELSVVASRLAGELVPGEATVTSGGEVVVSRRINGSFIVGGRVNDRELRFIFDTGATTVVLTPESARSIGINPEALNYSIPVSTANGRTMAAPITLDRLAVGPIAAERVRALVTRPGLLRENLLGMTFLERLASYEVRNNRLILRGRGT